VDQAAKNESRVARRPTPRTFLEWHIQFQKSMKKEGHLATSIRKAKMVPGDCETVLILISWVGSYCRVDEGRS